jgi:transposase InsO family protein
MPSSPRRFSAIHTESKGTYGSPRVHQVLRRKGVPCGRRRVARLMRIAGLEGRCKKRWRKTTIQDPDAQTEALDLIQRAFGPAVELDARYCGDITYVPTWQGWSYLATVIDMASRRVVGWALTDHMRAELVGDALTMAFAGRKPPAGVIFHSDRGCQYTSNQYRELAAKHGVRLSLGRKGECWDNALAESFFATIKRELIDRQQWPTRTGLHRALFEYIEGWYNTRRLHSSLGYCSPAEYEAIIHRNANGQAA